MEINFDSMLKNIYSFIQRHWICSSCLFYIIEYFILSLQGLPSADDGYVLVAYQNLFTDPTCSSYLFDRYLTALVGGLWELAFGWGGIISYRMFASLFIIGAFVIVCMILRDYWKYKFAISLSFFIVILTVQQRYGAMVFHYMIFSAFNACIVAYLLMKAYRDMSLMHLYMAAFVLGCNIFVRIPNIALCFIPFVLSFVSFLYHRENLRFFYQLMTLLIGILSGVACVFLIMIFLDHYCLFWGCMEDLSVIASDSNNSHGLLSMLTVVGYHQFVVALFVVIYLLVFWCVVCAQKIRAGILKNLMIVLLIGFIFFVVKLLSSYIHFPSSALKMVVLYGLILIMVLWYLKQQYNKNNVLVFIFVVLILLLQPLGSDGYLGNMAPFSIWISLPLSVVLFSHLLEKKKEELKDFKKTIAFFLILALIFCIPIDVTSFAFCFCDSGYRIQKTYRVSQSKMATCYTSFEHQKELNSLIRELYKHSKEGDFVFCGIDMPMINYITKTKPYLGNPWPRTMGKDLMIKKMESKRICSALPVVIEFLDKGDDTYYRTTRNVFHRYISSNKYSQIFASKHFKLFIPECKLD